MLPRYIFSFRINQRFVIATKTKIDVSKVKIPESINDEYFARVKADSKKKEGDIFESKKVEYAPSEQRKKDQVEVDKQVSGKFSVLLPSS